MLIARYASRLEALVPEIAAVLESPLVGPSGGLANPLAPELIIVPSRGVQVWLTQQLAGRVGAQPGRRDGVVANVEFGFPGTLAARLLTATNPTTPDNSRTGDPWELNRTLWTVLSLLREAEGDAELGSIARPPERGSLYDRARRIADLFDRYNVRRPHLIRHWAAGRLVDPTGQPLADRRWQAILWQRLRARIGEPSAAERLPDLLDQLRSGLINVGLPARFQMVGLSAWPVRMVELLHALSEHHDIHQFALGPSPAMIAAVQAHPVVNAALTPDTVPLRSADPTAGAAGVASHRLLASWGRPAREAALVWSALAPSPLIEVDSPPAAESEVTRAQTQTLLGRLQASLRQNREPDPQHQRVAPPEDQSFQVHACHGRGRQVEVLYELLQHGFEQDSTLIEDDVVVLAPNIEDFAPLVAAVFGPSADLAADGSAFRYRVTDQAIRAVNPWIGALTMLLDLVSENRFAASRVLDFLALTPVRHRFELTDEDLRLVADWVQQANVRWGLDSTTRSAWLRNVAPPAPSATAPTSPANSWQSAIDQLLLGAAVEDSPWTLVLDDVPTIGVEGGAVAVVGQIAHALRTLATAVTEVADARTVADWTDRMLALANELLAVPVDEDWQRRQGETALRGLVDFAAAERDATVTFADYVAAARERLVGAPNRSAFRPGTVTITSPGALRSVPHRHIYVLGFDDDAFGTSAADGDDLTLRDARVADPDRRNDERELLLETVLAARDRLTILRTGHDVLRNREVQEPVPLSELWDAVLAELPEADREAGRRAREIRHLRHGFDEGNFVSGALIPDGAFGHDDRLLGGALGRRSRAVGSLRSPVVAVRAPLEVDAARSVTLRQLHQLLRNPVQYFVQQGLQARIPYREDPIADTLPVALDGLEGWRIGMDLLGADAAGVHDLKWLDVAQRRGQLPPGNLSDAGLARINADRMVFLEAINASGGAAGRTSRAVAVVLDAPDAGTAAATTVSGVVAGVLDRDDHDQVARFEYKRPKPHHRLGAWLDLIAVTASHPDRAFRARLVTRGESKKPPEIWDLEVAGGNPTEQAATARTALAALVEWERRARSQPLPIGTRAAEAAAEGDQHGASRDWDRDLKDDTYLQLAWQDMTWSEVAHTHGAQMWSLRLWSMVKDSVTIASVEPEIVEES